MWNELKEANVMFRICALVRDQLYKEQLEGSPNEEVLERLLAFYKITCPKIAATLAKATPVNQWRHLADVLHNQILLILTQDETIDFVALRKFLTETWPDMNVDEAIRPTKPLFTTISGKEVCADPSFRVLLEKVGPDWTQQSSPQLQEMLKSDGVRASRSGPLSDLKFPAGVDPKDPVRSTLAFYWAAIVVSGINIDPTWQDFEVFEKWAMETGYKRFHVLRREDDLLGYVPGNVSWQEVSRPTQQMSDQVIDRRHDVQATLYNYWCHTKEGVFGPMDFVWAHDFPTFEKWAMENGYKHGMTVHRKVPEDGITPANCYIGPRTKPDRSGYQSARDL